MFRYACLLLALLATTARADALLGAQVGSQSLGIRETAPGASRDGRESTDVSLGFVVGLGGPGGGSRFTADFAGFQVNSRTDLDLFNLGYEQMLPGLPLAGDLRLRPFLGGELGYGRLRVDAASPYSAGDDSGPLAGVRAGLNLVLTERAELELGLRYSRVGLDATLPGPGGTAAHYEVRDNRGWWLGFNVGL